MTHDSVRRLPVQLRAAPELGEGVAVGYVTKYDVEYDVGWGQRESVAPGSFDRSIESQPVISVFWQHDWDAGPIGTAALASDETGVLATATLFIDDNERARAVYRAMQARALSEWSIGFYPTVISHPDDDSSLDRIEVARLVEASVVVRGANPETETLAVREAVDNEVDGEPEPELEPEPEPEPEPVSGAFELLAQEGVRAVLRNCHGIV